MRGVLVSRSYYVVSSEQYCYDCADVVLTPLLYTIMILTLLFPFFAILIIHHPSVCVAQKTKIEEYISNYEKTRKSQKHAQIDALVEILKGEGEDRFEKVFEGKSHLLPGFLVAAEDRRMNGYSEVRKPRAPKRKRDDTTNNLQGGGLEDGDDVDHLIDHADVHGEMMPEHHPDAHMNPMHHQEAQWQQQSQYQYWR